MSFITETYKCTGCEYYFNVALGTFGYGMPERCPSCKQIKAFEYITCGWEADEYNRLAHKN
jgi:hypothetical protein